MSEVKDKPDYKLRLSENYAIDTDPRNIILLEKYETRVGRGRNAEFSGEYSWRTLGYFQRFDQVADRLVEMEVFTTEQVGELYDFADKVQELKREMREFLKEKVELKME